MLRPATLSSNRFTGNSFADHIENRHVMCIITSTASHGAASLRGMKAMRKMVEDTMLLVRDGMTRLDIHAVGGRRGLLPTLGVSLAAGTSLVLWLALVQAARWAAHAVF